jgi:hypothetical protein
MNSPLREIQVALYIDREPQSDEVPDAVYVMRAHNSADARFMAKTLHHTETGIPHARVQSRARPE